jgi:NarL family two-component system response regulator LiaR
VTDLIRILVADENRHQREQWAILLDSYNSLQVVGTADNGKKVIDLCAILRPDIVLIDAQLPVMDGYTVTSLIRQQFPQIKVIILASWLAGKNKPATDMGESALLLKPVSSAQVAQVIQEVYGSSNSPLTGKS